MYKDGPENIFCISGRARNFWTALIGRALQKQTKKHKTGRATYISGPSLYAPAPVYNIHVDYIVVKLAQFGMFSM